MSSSTERHTRTMQKVLDELEEIWEGQLRDMKPWNWEKLTRQNMKSLDERRRSYKWKLSRGNPINLMQACAHVDWSVGKINNNVAADLFEDVREVNRQIETELTFHLPCVKAIQRVYEVPWQELIDMVENINWVALVLLEMRVNLKTLDIWQRPEAKKAKERISLWLEDVMEDIVDENKRWVRKLGRDNVLKWYEAFVQPESERLSLELQEMYNRDFNMIERWANV
jgi:hypothetical protein